MTGRTALESFYAALLEDDPGELYERAPCGYLSTTPDGTIIKVNGTLLSWTGYQREELVGRRSFSELLTPGGRIYHETHYAPLLQMQGSAREIALDIVQADGGRLPVLVNAVLVRDEHGQGVVVRAAIFDATDRREYERELLRAKRRAEESEERARLLARTLQQTLIPPAPPLIAGLDVAAVYRPAGDGREVGGDFYDVFEIATDDWMVVVGDVRGKGVEAAVVTARARYTLRGAAVRHDHPSDVLATLNEVLLRDDTDRFCTVAAVRLRRASDGWAAAVCCGGHPLPILVTAGAEPAGVGRFGSLLGVLPDPKLHDAEVALGRGDALVLFTDGVTEARRGDDFFGEQRLADSAVAHAGSATALTEGVLADALTFQEGAPRDDIVVVAVRVP